MAVLLCEAAYDVPCLRRAVDRERGLHKRLQRRVDGHAVAL
jgi:hypothetical protein